MERKTFRITPELEFKADAPGVVIARFAMLNVIDSDEDVTLPGAFGSQEVRMQPFGHNTGEPSIGKGVIREEGDNAIAELRMNLNMMCGKETYESLKFDAENGQPQTEWSYIFDIVKWSRGQFEGREVRFLESLKVHSVDPVFLGAGVGTATLSVKERGGKAHDPLTGTHTHYHSSYGAQGGDSGHTHEHNHAGDAGHNHDHAPKAKAITLPAGMSIEDLQEELRDEIVEAFPGIFGEETCCWLAETYDGVAIASAEGDDYYRIAWSVDAAGEVTVSGQPEQVDRVVTWVPTPEEDKGRNNGQTYADHAEHVLTNVQAFVARSRELAALREKEGRPLSSSGRSRLASLLTAMHDGASGIEALLAGAASVPGEPVRTAAPRAAIVLRLSELERSRRDLAGVR